MTETSPVSTQTRVDDPLERRVGTVGRAGPHVEVKVIDPETGLVVERGEPGELCTRGYSVMLGYWDDDPSRPPRRSTAPAGCTPATSRRWTTRATCNIVGRSKDMIIRGGENIYPREIEEFLYTPRGRSPTSRSSACPTRSYGEELCAWVVARAGAELDEDAVREFCRGRLAHFKVPRYVMFVDEFPMTVTGKVQKFKMRDDVDRAARAGGRGGGEAARSACGTRPRRGAASRGIGERVATAPAVEPCSSVPDRAHARRRSSSWASQWRAQDFSSASAGSSSLPMAVSP